MSAETFEVAVEYTDTYGGESNYAWVRRQNLTVPVGISDRALLMRARAAMGITGLRGRVYKHGDLYEFRPYRMATVMFVSVEY